MARTHTEVQASWQESVRFTRPVEDFRFFECRGERECWHPRSPSSSFCASQNNILTANTNLVLSLHHGRELPAASVQPASAWHIELLNNLRVSLSQTAVVFHDGINTFSMSLYVCPTLMWRLASVQHWTPRQFFFFSFSFFFWHEMFKRIFLPCSGF